MTAPPPARHLIERFLEAISAERNAAQNTLEAYRRDLEDAAGFLIGAGQGLAQAGGDDLRRYVAQLAARGLSPATQARRISALKQFYKFLFEEGVIAADPTLHLDAPKRGRALPKVLSEAEAARVMTAIGGDAAEAARLRCLLELAYASGLRVSELVRLPLAVAKPDARFMAVRGKGGKERLVPLNDAAREALKSYLAVRDHFLKEGARGKREASPFLFPSRATAGHLTRQRFGQLLKDVAVKAGIPPARLSPHVLRHAFATHLLGGGADLRALQMLLGHSDIATTQIYTHVADSHLAETVERHHPLARRGARHKP
ncbi:MAG: site-specific tyrosine recombinase XerD [Alphaproteobacteria bacterium]|nr:site-specific tyrosine recombinase XerD [Alphaproteobacteria bacterium]